MSMITVLQQFTLTEIDFCPQTQRMYCIRFTFRSLLLIDTGIWFTHRATQLRLIRYFENVIIISNIQSYFNLVLLGERVCNARRVMRTPTSRKSLISIDLSIVHFHNSFDFNCRQKFNLRFFGFFPFRRIVVHILMSRRN